MNHGDPQAYSDLYKDAHGTRPITIPEWKTSESYISGMRTLERMIWDDDEGNVEALLEQY